MSAAPRPASSRGLARPAPLGLALAGLLSAGLLAALCPTFARSWLLVFAIAGAAPVGATVLLMIVTLTGGSWAEAWRPALAPMAAATVAVAAAFLPVAVSLPAIYPWAADAGAAPPGVAAAYLNPPFFLLRAAAALGGWTILGLMFGRGRPSRLAAGLGLAFHGFAVSFVATDWLLSVRPGYTSSNFAALVAVGQIAAALALSALLGPAREEAASGRGALGALLIALVLGVGYLELMAFVIAWYGDLPGTIDWYVRRAAPGWTELLAAAFLIGLVLPVAILLRRNWRAGGPMLRLAAGASLIGWSLYLLWSIGPALGPVPTFGAAAMLALAAGGFALLHRTRGRAAHHAV